MSCQHFEPVEGGAKSFTVAMPKYTFGRGTLAEVGSRAASNGMKFVALFTDGFLLDGPYVATATKSLTEAGIEFAVFSDVRIEPDDATVMNAARFLSGGDFDGVVSVGGGSVIDTAKAGMVYSLYPSELTDYFGPPIGSGQPVPGPLLPHLACPTTSGTGSECTSVAVIRLNHLDTKFVMGSPYMLPQETLVDPVVCESLPAMMVVSTGFDLLCHAIECYTAKAYTKWGHVEDPQARTMLQGSNPWSDMAARKALEIVGQYLERGVADSKDAQARDALMFGASLAGMAFGNSGTHLPHAMSYGITHLMDNVTTAGYDVPSPFIPHGISVIVNAPAIFRYLASAAPKRHIEAARYLGVSFQDIGTDEVGEVLSNRIIELMKAAGAPNGIRDLGFDESQAKLLAESSSRQARAIANAPRVANVNDMESIFRDALSYW